MANKKKKKIKIITIAISLISILSIVCVLIYPSVYEYQCKTRHFDDFEKRITNDILESNIVIVKYEEMVNDNVTSYSYSVGASGVIFDSENDTYYVLTAYHVVQDFENANYIVIPYDSPTYSEYCKDSEKYIPNRLYYEQFEKAQIVCVDKEYDLAVISFKSEQVLTTLSICNNNPQYNEKIMVISNPEGERFVCSYGTILSRNYDVFKSDDKLPSTNTFKHSAYISNGSSGSAVLNQQMEIVGINIGGGVDFMNRFRCGAMVPSELICEFLKENYFSIKSNSNVSNT